MVETSTAEAKPDVAAIMKEIRQGIRERRDAGFFTHEDVEEETLARLRDYAADAVIDPRLLDRFLSPGHSWNTATDYFIRSLRPWPWGPLSIWIKKAVGPVVRQYTDHVLNRQTQINQYLLHVLYHTVRESTRLRFEANALRKHYDASRRGEKLDEPLPSFADSESGSG